MENVPSQPEGLSNHQKPDRTEGVRKAFRSRSRKPIRAIGYA